MAAHFTADTNLGAGYGIISIAQVNCNTKPSFALYRASDGLCLTPSGWQNSEIFLQPNNWDCDTNTLRLSVDASIVDHLDALDTYKIIIKLDTQDPIAQSLVIENIVYSSMHGGQGLGFTEVKPDPIPEPEPMPEPMQEVAEPAPMQEPLPEIAPVQKKSPVLMITTIVVILLLLAGGIWWYLSNQDQANQDPATNTEANIPTSDEEAKPATEPEAKSEEQVKPEEQAKPDEQSKTEPSSPESNNQAAGANTDKTLSPIQQAREFLRQDNQGQASLELAQSLQNQSQTEPSVENLDALFLLLEDAAQKNIPEAMLMVAKYYDPSNTEPKGSIEADVNEAYAWYTKALTAGVSDATKHLDQLKAWAQQAASNGDKTAHDLLNRWK